MRPLTLRPRALVGLLLYALAAHAVLAVAVGKTNFLYLAQKTLGLAPPAERHLDLYRSMLAWAERDRAVPDGAVLVLGDSMVHNLDVAQLGPDVHSFALGGSTVQNLLEGLPVLRSLERARAVVLGIGVNDMKYRHDADIARDYGALLDALPDGIPIVTVPLLPVDEANPAVRGRRYLRNSSLRALEDALAAVAAARPGTRRLARTTFGDAEGTLRPELHAGDGWHLSPAGAAELRRLIRAELGGLLRRAE